MKKIFTFVIALCTVMSISAADGSKTKIWEGDQIFDSSWPGIQLSAALFAETKATDHLVFDIKSVDQSLSPDWTFGPQLMIKDNTWADMNPSWALSGFGVGEVVADFDEAKLAIAQAGGIIIQGQQMEITAIYLMGSEDPGPIPGAVETYLPTDETGVAKAEWGAEANEAGNVVDIDATANVHLYALSGPETGWTDGTTLPLEAQYNNGWAVKNSRNNVWDDALGATKTLYIVNGGGNPTTGVAFAAKYKDDVATGDYRRSYRTVDDPNGPWFDETGKEFTGEYDFYYSPDGSKGLPKYGAYYKVTAKTDGVMKFLVWNNKGNRKAYVVDGETAVALDPLKGEVKYSGYVNGKDEPIDPADETLGKKMIYYELAATEDNPYCLQAEVNQGQAAWVYLTFNMTAGKTYWLFNENTQLGFGGFKFTPGAVPPSPTPAGLKGDADEDEAVTVSDITTIAAYILGNNPSPFNFDNADVDEDGAITVADITGTAGIILGK